MRFKFLSIFYGLNEEPSYIWEKSQIKSITNIQANDILISGNLYKLKENNIVKKKKFYLTPHYLYYSSVYALFIFFRSIARG